MNIKFALFLFIAFTCIAFPQVKDSVYKSTTKPGITDTTALDTSGILSTKKEIVKVDTTIPLYQNPFYSRSEFINRKQIDFLDYRYTGNLFKPFGISFLRDYGFVGYPAELMLYGTNEVSYFENGIYVNSRSSDYFNLNFIPSEMIDSIEIVPAPRGFLYSPVNNPVSVNLIKRDICSFQPYTRVKYYEGPSGEAFIDAIFNARIFKNFLLTIDISNRKVDSSYVNSDFSIWQGGTHLKYLLSDKINVTASYAYNKYEVGLNGGVNVDSLKQLTTNIDQYLYDNLLAPVYFGYRRINILQHNLGLRLLANLDSHSQTDFAVYYRFDNDEVSDPPDHLNYPQKDKNKTTGALLRQDLKLAFADLKFIAQYEKTNTRLYASDSYSDFSTDYFTFAPIFSLYLIDSTFVPSVYYKIQNVTRSISKGYHGFGFDLSMNPLDYLKLYGGYSLYKSPNLIDDVSTVELSAKINFENLRLSVDFINRSENLLFINSSALTPEYFLDLGTTQLGGNFSYKLWYILLEASAYFDVSKHKAFNGTPYSTVAVPKIKLNSGIYFDGYFFNENLNLKTGFAVNYNSKQRLFSSGQEYDIADQFATIDFTLAGEIKKAAIAYFTWENLFDETYYIVPYFPMFRRGIRFGVAWELFN